MAFLLKSDFWSGVQSPETAYTPPGPFSHPLGRGDTVRVYCQRALAHSPSGIPKRHKRIDLETSVQLRKYRMSSGCLSDDRKIRVSSPSSGLMEEIKRYSVLGEYPALHQHSSYAVNDCWSREGRGCWRHPGVFFRDNEGTVLMVMQNHSVFVENTGLGARLPGSMEPSYLGTWFFLL